MIKPLIDVVCDGCQYINECCRDKCIAMSKFSGDLNISNGGSDLSGNGQNNTSSSNRINNVDVNKIDKKFIAEVIAKSIIDNFKSNI